VFVAAGVLLELVATTLPTPIFSEEQIHFPQIGSQSFLVYQLQRAEKLLCACVKFVHSTVHTHVLEVLFEEEELVVAELVVAELETDELADQE
jgi:hypothetical protein